MPIEKNVTIDDLPDGDVSVEMDDEPSSSIDIEYDMDTGAALVNIGEDEDDVP